MKDISHKSVIITNIYLEKALLNIQDLIKKTKDIKEKDRLRYEAECVRQVMEYLRK